MQLFFDIDGTLYRDSLMIEHFKKLIKYEVIDPALWHSHVKHTYKEWQERVGEYEDYMEELAEIYVDSLRGLKKEEIQFISQQVINLKGDQVYTYTRHQIEWHKKQGHKVFFISGSPEHLVARMAHKYGVEDYKGTEYLLNPDGTFTGEVIPNWDADSKNRVIHAFVEQYGIALEHSYAYGDTNGDLSMMRLLDTLWQLTLRGNCLIILMAIKTSCKRAKLLLSVKILFMTSHHRSQL